MVDDVLTRLRRADPCPERPSYEEAAIAARIAAITDGPATDRRSSEIVDTSHLAVGSGHRRRVVLLSACVVLLVAALTAVLWHGGNSKRSSIGPAATRSASPGATCADGQPAAAGLSIILKNRPGFFDRDCYQVRAQHRITLRIVNHIFAAMHHKPVAVQVAISRHPVMRPVTGRPGLQDGSTNDAEFVSGNITAPATRQYRLPLLPPGRYVIELLNLSGAQATLLISATVPGRTGSSSPRSAASDTSPGGDAQSNACSASQLTLGNQINARGTGTLYTAAAFLYQRIRNSGPACRLTVPDQLDVTGSNGLTRTIPARALGRRTYLLPASASRDLTIGGYWPDPGLQHEDVTCASPVLRPTAVSVSFNGSTLRILVPPDRQRDLGGFFRGVWREVCGAPHDLTPAIGLERPRS